MENNGEKIYTLLVEINTRTNEPTGRIKPNLPEDPNYIAPAVDTESCPLPGDPDPVMRDILVVIGTGYAGTIKLIYGSSNVNRNTPGTWSVIDRTFDSVLFEVTTAPGVYRVRIEYGTSSAKQVITVGTKNIFIPGPFEDVTKVIIEASGDFDDDWNEDYLI